MNNSVKLLLWPLAGPFDKSGGEPWADRISTVGDILKSDAYDFIVLPGLVVPNTPGNGHGMLSELVEYMPGFNFTYTTHVPGHKLAEGIAICHRYSRWEADIKGGFRIWPPDAGRALFCVLYYELDEERKRTGRAVYVASSQIFNDMLRNHVIGHMLHELGQRPHPEYPVIWAGNTGIDDPKILHAMIGQMAAAPGEAGEIEMPLQDIFAILHPETADVVSTNNWRDADGEGVRCDFVLISDGLTPQSLDYNYIRTPGGQFPSNHYPQRAVLSFNDRPQGQLLN